MTTDAVILMAGAGSRLGTAHGAIAKPLVQIAERPLISHTLEALAAAGVRTLHIVTGANSERLAAEITRLLPGEMKLNAIVNPAWQKQNGVSVLCAADAVRAPFFLAMGDHLFDPAIFDHLLRDSDPERLNLAIDRKIASIFDLDDAMKVQTQGDRVVQIGKTLSDYNAIDTGLFLCPNELFDYLRRAQCEHDCSLADGVRLMAAEGRVRAIDIGDAWWQDVDTPEMYAHAEAHFRQLAASSHA
ncbi:MAG TPA: NTP transferase domain-containing protein [Chthoniobacterales bacterium]|nr:NTP transferase domain-containing protein [Chthoniobacterales bacterium]